MSCGICRQEIKKFGIKIFHMASVNEMIDSYILGNLLSIAFVKEDLKNNE